MASTAAHQPTLLEKLDLIPANLSLIGALLYAAVTGPFRGDSGADTYFHHITHAVARKLTSRLSTAQIQYVSPSLQTTYEKFCKSHSITPEIVTLKSGTKAFWVGDKTATNIAVYFHGGGFSLDAGDEHLTFWHKVQQELAKADKSIAFLYVAYTLVPHATYPTQIRESVEALDYVLNQLGRFPSDVILAGDSAGANLCLAVLSHLSHPSPDVPELSVSSKLKALVLVAPWISFKYDWPSLSRNQYKDIATVPVLERWSGNYLAGKPTSPYAEPVEAPASWWEGAKVEQILCVAGADEMLVDSIDEWVKRYKSVNPDTITFVRGKNETHIAPIIELRLMDSTETEQGKAIDSFLKARL